MSKKLLSLLLAGLLVFSLAGCGVKVKKDSGKKDREESTQEMPESTEDAGKTTDVEMPDNYENMDNVVLALMELHHAKDLSYYGTDTEDKDANAFYYPMAVLASLMKSQFDYEKVDGYYYLDDNTYMMFASALFASYGSDFESPEIPDESIYAKKNEDGDKTGFIAGEISMKAEPVSCVREGDDFRITYRLVSSEGKEAGTYEALIVPSAFDGENNQFYYAVKEFNVSDSSEEDYNFDNDGDSTEEGTSEESSQENIQEDQESSDDGDETASDYEEPEGESISQEEAEEQAKNEYGDGDYSYEGKETVGDKTYYNYSKTDEDGNKKNVLISEDGKDSISGNKNDDGSWSFDQ